MSTHAQALEDRNTELAMLFKNILKNDFKTTNNPNFTSNMIKQAMRFELA